MFQQESIPMRKAGVENFEIDWEKFIGSGNQHDVEAKYAKDAGKHDELVRYKSNIYRSFALSIEPVPQHLQALPCTCRND